MAVSGDGSRGKTRRGWRCASGLRGRQSFTQQSHESLSAGDWLETQR